MTVQVIVGEIAGAYGVKGWVKIYSHTDPVENILNYAPWRLDGDQHDIKLIDGRLHGRTVIAKLEGVDTRDQAQALRLKKIWVDKERFATLEPGQYYWADLIGLKVFNCDGQEFGQVSEMLATGANDVIVVKGERERLIPFVMGLYVKEVKLDEGFLRVDWDADF